MTSQAAKPRNKPGWLITAEVIDRKTGNMHRTFKVVRTGDREAQARVLAANLHSDTFNRLTVREWDRKARTWNDTTPDLSEPTFVIEPYRAKRIRPRMSNPLASVQGQAVKYATWLAQRDGIAVPHGREFEARVDWSYVESKRRRGARGPPILEKRPCAVSWGKRGDGSFHPCVTIDLPNWNWQPDAPVEEVVEALREMAKAA